MLEYELPPGLNLGLLHEPEIPLCFTLVTLPSRRSSEVNSGTPQQCCDSTRNPTSAHLLQIFPSYFRIPYFCQIHCACFTPILLSRLLPSSSPFPSAPRLVPPLLSVRALLLPLFLPLFPVVTLFPPCRFLPPHCSRCAPPSPHYLPSFPLQAPFSIPIFLSSLPFFPSVSGSFPSHAQTTF